MILIVGLGNPGEKYENNRHNVGFVVLDELVRQMGNGQWSMVKKFQSLVISHQPLAILVKPQTFMNSSGIAVKKLVDHYKIKTSDLWVIHDDLDIRLGEYKIQKGKGPKEHKGLMSIDEALGTSDYWHVRVGVDNRRNISGGEPSFAASSAEVASATKAEKTTVGKEYVLQDFSDTEMKVVSRVIKRVVNEIQSLVIEH